MDWKSFILATLGTVFTALISWVVKKLADFLNSKVKNAEALSYLTSAVDIVANAVKATYQTYVKQLKDENSFTLDAQKKALETAITNAKAQMSCELQCFLTENYGDITTWITEQVEATLYDLKNK